MTELISKFVAYVKDLGSGYPPISLGSCSSSSSQASLSGDDDYTHIDFGCSYLNNPSPAPTSHQTRTTRSLRGKDKLIIIGTAPSNQNHHLPQSEHPLSWRWPVQKPKKTGPRVSMQQRQWPVSVARPDGEELYILSRSTLHNNSRLNVGEREEEDEVRRTYIVPVPNRTVSSSSSSRRAMVRGGGVVNSSITPPPTTKSATPTFPLLPVVRVPATVTACSCKRPESEHGVRRKRQEVIIGQRDIHVIAQTPSRDDSIMMIMTTTPHFRQIERLDEDCRGLGRASDPATERPVDDKTNAVSRSNLRKLAEPHEITVAAKP